MQNHSFQLAKMEKYTNLEDAFRDTWNKLYKGAVKRNDPFHLPTVATTNGSTPECRTVVLRGTDTNHFTLTCWSDIRTPKVADLKIHTEMSWLFWSKAQSLQIRATGQTTVQHYNEATREVWSKIAPKNRKDYCAAYPPGRSFSEIEPEKIYPDWWGDTQKMTAKNTDFGYENFVVITTRVHKIDLLHLHRAGHQRAQFNFSSLDKTWKKDWVVP